MSKKQKSVTKRIESGLLTRTKLYGFELFMSAVGLLAIAFVVDYGIFSLFRHFSRDIDSYQGSDQVVIFLAAAMIVWLPVATFFYLRTRGELQASKQNAEVRAHKVIVSIYMVINTVVAVGALFYAVYALLEMAVGTTSGTANPVMRQIIPGVLMALWHGWLLFAFTNRRVASRRAYPISYSVITVVVVLTLFIVTAGSLRSQAFDQQRESDLSSIQSSIARYHDDEGQLPVSLEDVEILHLKNSLESYTYKKTSDTRYELCGEFVEDTRGLQQEYGSYAGGYTEYPVWNDHSSGLHCFKVQAPYDEAEIKLQSQDDR